MDRKRIAAPLWLTAQGWSANACALPKGLSQHNNLGKVRLLRMAYLGDAAAWGDAPYARPR